MAHVLISATRVPFCAFFCCFFLVPFPPFAPREPPADADLHHSQKVLLDPNAMSKDGTTSLSDYSPSEDGKWMAYGVSEAGSDWNTIRVRDIASGKDLDDVVRWVKFSGVSWRKDGSGFYYSRYDEPKPGAALTGLLTRVLPTGTSAILRRASLMRSAGMYWRRSFSASGWR